MRGANRSGFLAGVAVLAALTLLPSRAAEFGNVERFKAGVALEFPGLTLTFRGKRHVESPVFKPGFTFFDFEVVAGSDRKTVSWSSGTGLIDAASFTATGEDYELELKGSVSRRGWLRDNELILWRAGDWRQAAAQARENP